MISILPNQVELLVMVFEFHHLQEHMDMGMAEDRLCLERIRNNKDYRQE